MAKAAAITSVPETNGHRLSAPTPASALALADVAMADLLDSLYANGPTTDWSAQDIAIVEAVQEVVRAAYRRFAASRAGRERDALLETARLQAAARHLGDAALGL